ncbi:MAG: bifunctional (p)ppGpp synthetase/guanosine-3',5'-bis(diphosphate) 3'-pyrophosphohydrolase [Clostridia bacterium]|nr:bifunctional (p)ppGpp synthetase/guanosine-3',5'-bis(diphosphate) 3'-pyrophosphohydrolase [Clostridia bacterium]
MGTLLNRAIAYAVEAHDGQFRKGTQIPYILHPLEAAAVAATMTDDDSVLAAAVLHDVVEDTETTIEKVKELFGEKVAEYVGAESENKRENLSAESTWKIRKKETLIHLKSASKEIKMITLGDKLSNIRAINRDYKAFGDELWNRFNQKDKNEHCWYYQSIADCLSELEEYTAYQEYCALVENTFSK